MYLILENYIPVLNIRLNRFEPSELPARDKIWQDAQKKKQKQKQSKSKGGTVVRALSSHQCGPGSNTGVDEINGLSLLLLLSLALLRETHYVDVLLTYKSIFTI